MKEGQYEKLSEEEIVKLAKDDDEIALDLLFEKYKRVVRAKAQMYFIAGGDADDLVQEGMIGLFRAIRDYDEKKDMTFRSFAQMCINRQMITAIRQATRKKHVPLNSSVSLQQSDCGKSEKDVVETLELISQEGQPEERMLDKEAAAALQRRIEKVLSSFERKVLMQMGAGMTYGEIARSMGKDKKAIDNAIQRIKRKVKDLFQETPGEKGKNSLENREQK